MREDVYTPLTESPIISWKDSLLGDARDLVKLYKYNIDLEKMLNICKAGDFDVFLSALKADIAISLKTETYGAEHLSKLFDIMNVLFLAVNCYEFRINMDSVKSDVDYFTSRGAVEFPFDDICFTFKLGDSYDNTFIQYTKLLESYKLPSGELTDAYMFKLCVASNDRVYSSIGDMIYIKELHPRLFIRCGAYKGCEGFATFDIDSRMYNRYKKPAISGNTHCIKTPRTAHICPVYKGFRLAGVGFSRLSIIWKVLAAFNSRGSNNPSQSLSVSKEVSLTKSTKVVAKNKLEFSVIDVRLNECIMHVKNGRRYGFKHKDHKSPRKHERLGHVRHLRSGKTVVVQGSIINKDKEDKTVYYFK